MSSAHGDTPLVADTSSWFRNLRADGKLHCGWCVPSSVAQVHLNEPIRKLIKVKSGDFYVLAASQIDAITFEEKQNHKYCGE